MLNLIAGSNSLDENRTDTRPVCDVITVGPKSSPPILPKLVTRSVIFTKEILKHPKPLK